MVTIRMVSYEEIVKYPLEYCYHFTFAKFRPVSLKTQGVRKPPHAKIENILKFRIQTAFSTAVVDVFTSNLVH